MPVPGTLTEGLDSIAEAIKAHTVALREQSELLREIAGKLKDSSPEPVHPGEPDIPIPSSPDSPVAYGGA